METFVVVPCLNEEQHLAATCSSLGLGCGSTFPARLVLVDNGSTDATPVVMAQIRDAARPGKVSIVHEPIRGYVPARHAGVNAVMELARQEGLLSEGILVLQADADTTYLPGYIDAMRAACSGRRGDLIEGSAVTGCQFSAQFREFDELCRRVDSAMERWLAADGAQVIVDDKVCGFLLSDYWEWGGHRREVDHLGREIHAETTRLFMHAKQAGSVRRIKVEVACAVPSRRKLWAQGPAYFASAGFPRDAEWVRSWVQDSPTSHEFLTAPYTWTSVARAIRSRQRHQLALFALLPAMCQTDAVVTPYLAALASDLCQIAGNEPGRMLGIVLSLADEENAALDGFLEQHLWVHDPCGP